MRNTAIPIGYWGCNFLFHRSNETMMAALTINRSAESSPRDLSWIPWAITPPLPPSSAFCQRESPQEASLIQILWGPQWAHRRSSPRDRWGLLFPRCRRDRYWIWHYVWLLLRRQWDYPCGHAGVLPFLISTTYPFFMAISLLWFGAFNISRDILEDYMGKSPQKGTPLVKLFHINM